MMRIPITQGRFAIIDDEDYEKVKGFRWCFHGDGYAARGYHSAGKLVIEKMHQCIMGKPENGMEIDHINGDKLDNRKQNLRVVSHQQNVFNSSKRHRKFPGENPSRFKGVTWRNDRGKWRSNITLNGHRKYLGLYDTEREAALAYNKAAAQYFGEYANLNKIEEDK